MFKRIDAAESAPRSGSQASKRAKHWELTPTWLNRAEPCTLGPARGGMRILHLSDFHLTGDIKSLETAWHSPSAALKSGDPDSVIFDAIIVSGDLSQEAGAEEYVHLREFVDGTLLDLVRDRQRRRIVFVPGNHDVQWGATVSKKAPLSKVRKDSKQQDVSRIVRDKRVQPGSSDWRHRITSGGDIEFRKVDRDCYGRRFDNVQHFLEGMDQKELRDEPH